MAFRIAAAFFSGRTLPIRRLMMLRDYVEMPLDFLESWTTVIWTLDIVRCALASSDRDGTLLSYVGRLRVEVVKVLGLTPSELSSDTVTGPWSALDRTIGLRRHGLRRTRPPIRAGGDDGRGGGILTADDRHATHEARPPSSLSGLRMRELCCAAAVSARRSHAGGGRPEASARLAKFARPHRPSASRLQTQGARRCPSRGSRPCDVGPVRGRPGGDDRA